MKKLIWIVIILISIITSIVIRYVSTLEPLKNYYYIESVEIKPIQNFGNDTSGCTINQEISGGLRRDKPFGFAIKINKKFISDSTEALFLSYRSNGLRGAKDSIVSLQIFNDDVEVTHLFQGRDSISYVSPEKIEWGSENIGYICAPELFGKCNCVGTPVFENLDQFVSEYNDNGDSVIGEGLDMPFYFWDFSYEVI